MNKYSRTIDGREFVLYGPNAAIVEWLSSSKFARVLMDKCGITENVFLKILSKQNPEEQAIESKKVIRQIWYSYPEFGPYPFLDMLSELEHQRFFYNDYRDHIIHQLKVFLLGIYIFDNCEIIRKSINDQVEGETGGIEQEFLRQWTLCALSHDIGYILENENALNPKDSAWIKTKEVMETVLTNPISVVNQFSDIDLLDNNEEMRVYKDLKIPHFNLLAFADFERINGKDILEMIAQHGITSNLGISHSPFRSYYDYAIAHDPHPPKRKRFRDHGIAGAILLVQTWTQYQERLHELSSVDHFLLNQPIKKKLEEIKIELEDMEKIVFTAAGAIALHNINPSLWREYKDDTLAKKLTLDRFNIRLEPLKNGLPYAFLLILCDMIQEWDRYRFRAMTTADTPYPSDQDMVIKIDNGHICLDYREDVQFKNPPAIPASKFSRVKKELYSCLEPEMIDQIIQWKPLISIDEKLDHFESGVFFKENAGQYMDSGASPQKSPTFDDFGRNVTEGVSNNDPSQLSVRHNLPIEPTNIVGRDQELGYILKALSESEKPIILIAGFGGIGKSTLAKLTAWGCLKQQDLFDLIVWIDIRQYNKYQYISLNYILDTIAKCVDINTDINSINNIDRKKDRVMERLKSHRSLIILDNYEDLLRDPKEEQELCQFLGSLPIGTVGSGSHSFIRILITTREVSANLRNLYIDEISIEKLSLHHSLKLMKTRTPHHRRFTHDQYERIWEILCGLPKYMQIAIDQLRTINFSQWEEMISEIDLPLDEGEKFFHDLFCSSWQRFSVNLKKILMTMTYFVGEASAPALQKTAGLSKKKFFKELSSASDTYIESTGTGYTMHPLTHSFCRAMLNSPDFQEFKMQSDFLFIEYYFFYLDAAKKENKIDVLEKEIWNIIAATNIAYANKAWNLLTHYWHYLRNFLRNRGYWKEKKELALKIIDACQQIGEKEQLADRQMSEKKLLAECLIDDLSYLILRFEDLDEAEKYIKKGLEIYRKLGNLEGIAQAKRHLGKSELLRGLDDWYKPTPNAHHNFNLAEKYYLEASEIFNQLNQKENRDLWERIGYIQLDLGRLYWLQGQKYEQDGRSTENNRLLKNAMKKYSDANEVSEAAKKILIEIGSERGVSKAWGNLGNATKELAKCLMKNGALEKAKKYINNSYNYYKQSLEIAEKLKRKDEISHALWGIAEVYEFFADYADSYHEYQREECLKKALDYAQNSHRLYKDLVGRKDINATNQLLQQINDKIKRLHS